MDLFGGDDNGTLEVTPARIDRLEDLPPTAHSIAVQPYMDGGGIRNGIELLQAIHDVHLESRFPGLPKKNVSPEHSFETRYINGLVGFQFVPGSDDTKESLLRQLRTFYPDSNFVVSEAEQPPLFDYKAGYHLAAAHLELLRTEGGEYLYPIRHIDIDGFESDPYGSITAEMTGNDKSGIRTDVVTQVTFRPAKSNWWKGPFFGAGIDKIAQQLTSPNRDDSFTGVLKREVIDLLEDAFDEEIPEKTPPQPGKQEKQAAKILKNQRGKPGFHVNVRILAMSETQDDAIRRVRETAGMYRRYYESATMQGFDVHPAGPGEVADLLETAARRELKRRENIMHMSELGGVAHIPNDTINTEHVEWSKTGHSGSLPVDAEPFAAWQAPEVDWEKDYRTHRYGDDRGPSEWPYDIPADPTESETADPEATT